MKTIRTLAAAAILAVALTALLGAASASASGFLADKYPAYPVAKQVEGHVVFENVAKFPNKCSGLQMETTMPGARESLSMTPNEPSCQYGPMKPNGCKFIFNPAQGTFDIGPVGCGPITLYGGGCDTLIPAQYGLAATYTNEGSGAEAAVKVALNASVTYTQTSGHCGPNGTYTGKLYGTLQLKGYRNAGHTEPTGIHVGAPTGLFLGGSPTVFQAEAYTAGIAGAQSKTITLKGGGSTLLKCMTALFNGETASATSALSLGVEGGGCLSFGYLSTVNCQYGLNVANGGPPYTGTVDLACSIASSVCTVTIAKQAVGAVTYENTGAGSGKQVAANFNGEGYTYSVSYPKGETEGKCGKAGSFSNGTVSGALSLHAFS